VLELARTLVRLGHVVHVLCPEVRDAQYAQTIEGVTIHRFRYWPFRTGQTLVGNRPGIESIRSVRQSLKIPLLVISQLISLLRLIKRERIGVVNSHWLIPQGVTAAIAARICGVKHLATLHSTDVFLAGKLPLGRYLCRFVDKASADVFIVSNFVKQRYDEVLQYSSAAKVVPMGVDTEKFTRVPLQEDQIHDDLAQSRITILFVGRLVPIKGVQYLIEATRILVERRLDIMLVIIGDGDERNTLEKLTRDVGLDERTQFLGPVENHRLPEYYRRATLVVVPSLMLPSGETEGMPVVVLESMACGTPVVASNVGGIPDIIEDGRNGFLVEPGNSAQLANAISNAIYSIEVLANNAYETGQRYSWTNVIKEYIDSARGEGGRRA